jgi:hypothetical protein
MKYLSLQTMMKINFNGHVACTGEMRNAYKMLVRKFDGKTTWKTYA